MDGNPELILKQLGKLPHLGRLRAFGATQAKGQADDDFLNLILGQQPSQRFQIAALVLPLERLEALGSDAERVGDRDPDPFGADIQGEDAFGRRVCLVHRTIIDWARQPRQWGGQRLEVRLQRLKLLLQSTRSNLGVLTSAI